NTLQLSQPRWRDRVAWQVAGEIRRSLAGGGCRAVRQRALWVVGCRHRPRVQPYSRPPGALEYHRYTVRGNSRCGDAGTQRGVWAGILLARSIIEGSHRSTDRIEPDRTMIPSVKVVRTGLGAGNIERRDLRGFHGNHAILILQSAINDEKSFRGQQQSVLLKQIRRDNRVGNSGFIF